ncbi:gasdermin-D-like isoform X1 [Grammomys surdaster]|uniref:gasdermin-D-like isoform X1 n=1 Tax=Grammomys surdaster TaxID=491861 RepID=UPI00109EF72B|nr:gasdermin-D-like isoform X1 [Grammomys surdaster]
MPSAFEKVVKSVIQEVGGSRGDLIPVDCLRNSTRFKPYSLLSRRLSSSWFWKPRYICVNLSIKDILEPSAPEPEPECIGHFQVSDVIDGNIQGSVAAFLPIGEGKISGEAAVSDSASASMSMCILHVNPKTWDIMERERHLQQPENTILQQLRRRGDDVFVITEVLQTKEEVQITQSHSQEGSGQFTLPGASCFKGEGKGHRSRKKMVTIPAGSVLAFRVAKLLIGSTWGIHHILDEKERTFEPSSDHRRGVDQEHHSFNLLAALHSIGEKLKFMSDGIPEEEEFREDFQGLYAEVKTGSLQLGNLEMELRQQLLVDIGRILQDQPSLEALEASLGQGLCSGEQVEPLDGPAGCILECLVLDSGELVLELTAPIFYLLGALNVLSETQRQLLAKALETTVLSKQLELVEHILEQSTPWQEQSSVSLPSGLLCDSWDEEAPTWVLLEECGLRVQVEPPQVHWEPTSQGPTCALYASLALLSSLGQKPH